MSTARPSFGVAFDLDGTLYAGSREVASTTPSLQRLQELGVPLLYLTNGGGSVESLKAEQLTKKLGVPVAESEIQVAHTPMKDLAREIAPGTLVFTAGRASREVVESYGLAPEDIVTADEYHRAHPSLYPDIAPDAALEIPPSIAADPARRIKAAIVVMDPLCWNRDLQLLCDVVRGDGTPGTDDESQPVSLYLSGTDLEYVTEVPVPRFGSGAFRCCLEHLYRLSTGRDVSYTLYGKPERRTFAYAERLLNARAAELLPVSNGDNAPLERFYMVGDNPQTDIAGANAAGAAWASALVRTGIFPATDPGGEAENHPQHPADMVGETVGEIVEQILARERL